MSFASLLPVNLWLQADSLALASGSMKLWVATHANLALANMKLKDWDAVEVLTTELLEKEPRHEKALFRRGFRRESRGDFAGARTYYMKAASVNFMNLEAQDALARIRDRR